MQQFPKIKPFKRKIEKSESVYFRKGFYKKRCKLCGSKLDVPTWTTCHQCSDYEKKLCTFHKCHECGVKIALDAGWCKKCRHLINKRIDG